MAKKPMLTHEENSQLLRMGLSQATIDFVTSPLNSKFGFGVYLFGILVAIATGALAFLGGQWIYEWAEANTIARHQVDALIALIQLGFPFSAIPGVVAAVSLPFVLVVSFFEKRSAAVRRHTARINLRAAARGEDMGFLSFNLSKLQLPLSGRKDKFGDTDPRAQMSNFFATYGDRSSLKIILIALALSGVIGVWDLSTYKLVSAVGIYEQSRFGLSESFVPAEDIMAIEVGCFARRHSRGYEINPMFHLLSDDGIEANLLDMSPKNNVAQVMLAYLSIAEQFELPVTQVLLQDSPVCIERVEHIYGDDAPLILRSIGVFGQDRIPGQ